MPWRLFSPSSDDTVKSFAKIREETRRVMWFLIVPLIMSCPSKTVSLQNDQAAIDKLYCCEYLTYHALKNHDQQTNEVYGTHRHDWFEKDNVTNRRFLIAAISTSAVFDFSLSVEKDCSLPTQARFWKTNSHRQMSDTFERIVDVWWIIRTELQNHRYRMSQKRLIVGSVDLLNTSDDAFQ